MGTDGHRPVARGSGSNPSSTLLPGCCMSLQMWPLPRTPTSMVSPCWRNQNCAVEEGFGACGDLGTSWAKHPHPSPTLVAEKSPAYRASVSPASPSLLQGLPASRQAFPPLLPPPGSTPRAQQQPDNPKGSSYLSPALLECPCSCPWALRPLR